MVKACRFSSLYDGSLSKKPLGLGLERHSTTKRQEIVRVSKMKKEIQVLRESLHLSKKTETVLFFLEKSEGVSRVFKPNESETLLI